MVPCTLDVILRFRDRVHPLGRSRSQCWRSDSLRSRLWPCRRWLVQPLVWVCSVRAPDAHCRAASDRSCRPIAKDDPALSTTLFGFYTLSRGIGYILSTPISTALFRGGIEDDHVIKTGFEVGGGKYEQMIIYVGTCFAGAAVMSVVGWGVTYRGRR
jgi:hypothetical protein